MTMSAVEDYLVATCPICAEDTELDYISVDGELQPTFRYKCPGGHEFTKFRKRPLDKEELAKVVTLTKRRYDGDPDVA